MSALTKRTSAFDSRAYLDFHQDVGQRHLDESAPLPLIPANRVRSLRETADAAGISLATLRRRIADGTGPRLTRMSQRRIGVTDRNREAWLAACEVDEPEAA
jgi:predicted DNA-binding transcriptional regulator AlpA